MADVVDEPPPPAAHYEAVLLNELCTSLLTSANDGLRRPVQFVCRIEGVDNFVNAAVAVDPENSAFRLPLSTRLVSPLDGPASGLWRVYGVLHGGAAVRRRRRGPALDCHQQDPFPPPSFSPRSKCSSRSI